VDESTIDGAIGAGRDAVVADAAAQEIKPGRRWDGEDCANCGTKLAGPHCQVCGQVADDLHRPIWALVHDGLEGLFSLDGRILKTVPPLLLRPGRVSQKYLSGARARFVQPVRLFLFASVAFLLAVSIATGDWTDVSFDDEDFDSETLGEASADLAELRDELEADGRALPPGVALAQAEVDAAIKRSEDRADEIVDDPRLRELRRIERMQERKCEIGRASCRERV